MVNTIVILVLIVLSFSLLRCCSCSYSDSIYYCSSCSCYRLQLFHFTPYCFIWGEQARRKEIDFKRQQNGASVHLMCYSYAFIWLVINLNSLIVVATLGYYPLMWTLLLVVSELYPVIHSPQGSPRHSQLLLRWCAYIPRANHHKMLHSGADVALATSQGRSLGDRYLAFWPKLWWSNRGRSKAPRMVNDGYSSDGSW